MAQLNSTNINGNLAVSGNAVISGGFVGTHQFYRGTSNAQGVVKVQKSDWDCFTVESLDGNQYVALSSGYIWIQTSDGSWMHISPSGIIDNDNTMSFPSYSGRLMCVGSWSSGSSGSGALPSAGTYEIRYTPANVDYTMFVYWSGSTAANSSPVITSTSGGYCRAGITAAGVVRIKAGAGGSETDISGTFYYRKIGD